MGAAKAYHVCSGNAAYEPGAVVCRVSPSFVRFGTFQLPALRGGDQLPLVRQLADYVIRHLYSHLDGDLLGHCASLIHHCIVRQMQN